MLPGDNGSRHTPCTSVGPHADEPDQAGVGQLAALVGKEAIAKCGNETRDGTDFEAV